MVTTPVPALKFPGTLAGKFEKFTFVAPVVAYVIGVMLVLTFTDCALVPAAEVRVTVLFGVTETVTALVTACEQGLLVTTAL